MQEQAHKILATTNIEDMGLLWYLSEKQTGIKLLSPGKLSNTYSPTCSLFKIRECTYSYIQNQTNLQNLVSAVLHNTGLVLSTEQINYTLKSAC